MKSQTQEELILKELEMVKEVVKTKNKERLKHHQEIITKADAKIDFRNREIKSFRNEQLDLYEELKGMEEVLHE
jgi:predicted house-cleaning noncanonical NTP pyrophosphatase (MazG superfamily)